MTSGEYTNTKALARVHFTVILPDGYVISRGERAYKWNTYKGVNNLAHNTTNNRRCNQSLCLECVSKVIRKYAYSGLNFELISPLFGFVTFIVAYTEI